jgi:hypothetical protein
MSIPILVSDSVVIPPGGTAVANAGRLSSPFRQAIVIDEIRWSTYNAVEITGVFDDTPSWNVGAVVRTKLNIGRVDVTNGFVPIWLFGTTMQANYFVEVNAVRFSVPNANDEAVVVSHYRWRLPRPLYLAPGNALQSSFQHNDVLTLMGDTTVHVAYAGRYATPEDKPKNGAWEVPWVTPYLPAANVVHAQSSEKDLVNPFLVPLNVQRMLYRAVRVSDALCVETTDSAGVEILIKDSHGVNIIRDAVSPAVAMDMPRRAWTFQTVLNPKERYNVTFTGMTDASPEQDSVQLAMVGWRNERIA